LRRLYSTFPGRWPGIGLLLLRVAIGVTLIFQGCARLSELQDMRFGVLAACVLAVASGGSLILGFLSPVACALAVLAGFGNAVLSPSPASNLFSGNPLSFDVLIMVLASGLLGPGAFSLDAHLFGRRKIVIPRSSHSQASLSSPSVPSNSSPPYSPASSSSRPPGSSPSRPPQA
jgi:uncharacterized membrane protein YphA (DoxX/SURF4 family)